MTDVDGARPSARPLLRLGAAGDRRVPQGGRAVPRRPAAGARRAAREDRRRLSRQRRLSRARGRVPRARAGDDQPDARRGRRAGDADPALLTEEIFAHVFDAADFHRENNIAQELYALEGAFFTGAVKQDTLRALKPFYAAIRAERRADHQPPREAELPEGDLRELLQGLQPEGGRPARRGLHAERDRALHGARAPTGCARSTSARR